MPTTDRMVKITNLAIARFAEEAVGNLTATGEIIGTADYLAPERTLDRPAQPAWTSPGPEPGGDKGGEWSGEHEGGKGGKGRPRPFGD